MARYTDFFDEKNGEKILKDDKRILVEGWVRDGLTDIQVAHNLGIAYTTFKSWKKKFISLATILKKTKEVVDFQVENTLFKRAIGSYKVSNQQFKMVKRDTDVVKAERATLLNQFKIDHASATKSDIQSKMLEIMKEVPIYERIQISETVTEIPPDTSAAIFWLKNRRPDKFRDSTFKRLNEAQAKKAELEANLTEMKIKMLESGQDNTEAKVSEYLDKLTEALDGGKDEPK